MEFRHIEAQSLSFDAIDFSVLSGNSVGEIAEFKAERPIGIYERIRIYSGSMEENYQNSEFPELVQSLKDQLTGYDRSSDHPNYISEGTESAVFSIYNSEGEHFAARLPQTSGSYNMERRGRSVGRYMEGFALGEGVDGLEQLTAASKKDCAIISPFLPGCTLDELKKADYKKIESGHVQKFTDGVSAGMDQGVAFDTVQENFIFDHEAGFTAIDYLKETNINPRVKSDTLRNIYRGIIGPNSKFVDLRPSLQNSVLEEFQQGVFESESLDLRDKKSLHEWIADPRRL